MRLQAIAIFELLCPTRAPFIAQCMWIKVDFFLRCFKSSHCESLLQVLGRSSFE